MAEAAWKKFSPKFSKSEDSALDLFIKEYSPQDVMSTRDLLEYVSKPKPKKVESGYNKEREETHV